MRYSTYSNERKINTPLCIQYYPLGCTEKQHCTECTSLLEESIFHPVFNKTLAEDQVKSVLRSTCLLKKQTTPDGVFDKLKARIEAGENQQDKTIYTLEETPSPKEYTAAVAAHQGGNIIMMDVETVYLNAKMIEGKPIYMRLDILIIAVLSQI